MHGVCRTGSGRFGSVLGWVLNLEKSFEISVCPLALYITFTSNLAVLAMSLQN